VKLILVLETRWNLLSKTRKVLKERLNGTNNILIVICRFASRAKQQANDEEMSFGMSTREIPPLSKKIFVPK